MNALLACTILLAVTGAIKGLQPDDLTDRQATSMVQDLIRAETTSDYEEPEPSSEVRDDPTPQFAAVGDALEIEADEEDVPVKGEPTESEDVGPNHATPNQDDDEVPTEQKDDDFQVPKDYLDGEDIEDEDARKDMGMYVDVEDAQNQGPITSDKDKKECVGAFNHWRGLHQCTGELKWDDDLAKKAYCQAQYKSGKFGRRAPRKCRIRDKEEECIITHNKFYENTCKKSVDSWYHGGAGHVDRKTCKLTPPQCYAHKALAIVWKRTTKVGFGSYVKVANGKKTVYVAACYDHPDSQFGFSRRKINGMNGFSRALCDNLMPLTEEGLNKVCSYRGKSRCKSLKEENKLLKPVDGTWGSWTDGPCNRLCGKGGKRKQTRICKNLKYCGKECPGPSSRYVPCNEDIDCKAECVKTHNMYRRFHTVTGDLEWDDELERKSQVWTDLQMANSRKTNTQGRNMQHDYAGCKKDKVGENMAMITNNNKRFGTQEIDLLYACRQATFYWYGEEIFNYDFLNGKSKGGVIGHFTQVVWRGTEKFGLAIAVDQYNKGKDGYEGAFYATVFAKYFPAGNMQGKYKVNVGLLKPESIGKVYKPPYSKWYFNKFLAGLKKKAGTLPK